jgi:hypothetical protein
VLVRFAEHSKGLRTIPIDPNTVRELSQDILPPNTRVSGFPYREIIGSVMYAMLYARPDISFAVSFLSRFSDRHNERHCKALCHLLDYLRQTRDYGILYRHVGSTVPIGYCDASYAEDTINRKSTTGYIFKFAGAPIAWKSKLQELTATSSAEAELIAACSASKDAVHLKQLLGLIGFPQPDPIIINMDNLAAISTSNNTDMSQKLKHLAVRYFYTQEQVKLRNVAFSHMRTHLLPADAFTKAKSKGHFQLMLKDINIGPYPMRKE